MSDMRDVAALNFVSRTLGVTNGAKKESTFFRTRQTISNSISPHPLISSPPSMKVKQDQTLSFSPTE